MSLPSLLSCAVPANAQAVKLRFHDGLVTLSTQNAPLRAILTEWARQGGTTIVNGERWPEPPLSLELNAVPERQALDVLLRGVSGYMLAPASPAGQPGVSVFDRIMILPTSTAAGECRRASRSRLPDAVGGAAPDAAAGDAAAPVVPKPGGTRRGSAQDIAPEER